MESNITQTENDFNLNLRTLNSHLVDQIEFSELN